jgi:hypothetical protein
MVPLGLLEALRIFPAGGGAVGARTPNLRRAKAMLSQLSYSPLVAVWYRRRSATVKPAAAAGEAACEHRLGDCFGRWGAPWRVFTNSWQSWWS